MPLRNPFTFIGGGGREALKPEDSSQIQEAPEGVPLEGVGLHLTVLGSF